MEPTTGGRYRVLGRPRDPDELLLVDVEGDGYDPTYVPVEGRDAELPAGTLVDATLAWTDGTPRFVDCEVVRRTRIEFYDGVTGLFEAARETWTAAAAADEAMNSRVTRGTDGEVNGVLYVFARQSGARDLFEEFESGIRPLEPLIERINENREPAERAVFVMRPAAEPFVVVYIALEVDGLLAETVRETYAEGDGAYDPGRGGGPSLVDRLDDDQ